MLTIEVELLHGTFRASTHDVALTGLEDPGEWPPSPARLFAAFVAADGTRDRCRVTDGSELRFLESQPPPVIHADRPSNVTTSPLHERFVVVDKAVKNTVQDYPARNSSVARPGTRRSPRHPHVVYVWPHASPGSGTLDALRLRAARIGYLGCSDSPVRVRVSDQPPTDRAPTDLWEPTDAGTAFLPVPYEGLVDVLDDVYDQFREGATRRSWFRTQPAAYREPGRGVRTFRVGGAVIWLRFQTALAGRRILDVTETLRKAIFELYQREVAGEDGDLPAVLTGHGFVGRGFQHVHWLALPDAGNPRSRGRIHGAAIWMPDGTPAEAVAGVRTAAWRLRELVKPKVFSTEVAVHGGEAQPWASHPRRWQKSSRRFVSVFPVVHERFTRPRPSLEEVSLWCEHSGLPAPVAARLRRDPWLRGGASLHPREVFRASDERYPYSHVELVFDRPVTGPVMLGRKRQFGLGLFAPIDENERTDG